MTTDQADPTPLPESTHPYAVRVSLVFGSNADLEMSENEMRFRFAGDYTIRVVKELANPREQANALKRLSVHLEAFPSASEAERAGKLLAVSLLWLAASKRVTLAFEKWTGDFPFAIRDRTQSPGLTVRAEGRVSFNIRPDELQAIAEEAFRTGLDVTPALMASMEFYASARMETTERAKFIGLITALEALSVQCDYGDDIGNILAELAKQLEASPLLAGEANASLRCSLSSRLRQLRQESVRQAIIRTVRQHINDRDTIKFVDEAYGVRSKILHEGMRAPELYALTHRLEDVMRQIYSSLFGLSLSRPV